jgi:lysozyme family protein
MSFDIFFDRLIGNEGGYVHNPSDPGGETNWGISKRAYPTLDIPSLTRDEAKAIYLRDYWGRAQLDQMASALAFQVFDAAANHGVETAIRLLQRAVGVADDGHVGPITMAAVGAVHPFNAVVLFTAERIDFWRKLTTWSSFGNGWAGRAAADLRYAAKDL